MVEAAGVEPASAGSPLLALHAQSPSIDLASCDPTVRVRSAIPIGFNGSASGKASTRSCCFAVHFSQQETNHGRKRVFQAASAQFSSLATIKVTAIVLRESQPSRHAPQVSIPSSKPCRPQIICLLIADYRQISFFSSVDQMISRFENESFLCEQLDCCCFLNISWGQEQELHSCG